MASRPVAFRAGTTVVVPGREALQCIDGGTEGLKVILYEEVRVVVVGEAGLRDGEGGGVLGHSFRRFVLGTTLTS